MSETSYIYDFEKKLEEVKAKKDENKSVLRRGKLYEYNIPYNMWIMKIESVGTRVRIEVGIDLGEGKYTRENFRYALEGTGSVFFDIFVDSFYPGFEGDVTADMLLGRCFVGTIVRNQKYVNLRILDVENEDSDGKKEEHTTNENR